MEHLPEPWLRGPVSGAHPLVAPVLYAFQQAREDLERATEGLTPEQIWARPYGLAPLGFHLKHIAGSVERLTTYLEGRQLNELQLAATRSEMEPGADRRELLSTVENSLRAAEGMVRGVDPATLAEAREVGRQRLPTTVIGLLTHIAEHTQRHVGQAVSAAKLARAAVRLLLLAAFLLPGLCVSADLVTDEALRMKVLRRAFPQAAIQAAGRSAHAPAPAWKQVGVGDAMAGEKEYRVTAPVDEDEEGWAEDAVDGKTTTTRRLRFKVFRPAGFANAVYAAVLLYNFPAVRPPMCCTYFGRVYLFSKEVAHTGESLVNRGSAFDSVAFADLNGDGADEILVEAERTGVGENGWVGAMILHVFDVSRLSFAKLLELKTAEVDLAGNTERRVLDVAQTRQAGARTFYFSKTRNGKVERETVEPTAELPPGITAGKDARSLPLPESGYQVYLIGELHGVKETEAVIAAWLEKLAGSGLRDVAIEEDAVYEADARAYVEGSSDRLPEALCLRSGILDIVRRFNKGRAQDRLVRIRLVDVDSPADAIRAHLLGIAKQLDTPGAVRVPLASDIQRDGIQTVEQLKRLTADHRTTGELRTVEHSIRALRQGFEVQTGPNKGSPYLADREEAIAANILDLVRDRDCRGVLALYGIDHVSKARRKDGGPDRNSDFAPMALRLEQSGVKVFSAIAVPLSGRWFWRGRSGDMFWTARDASLAEGHTVDEFLATHGRPPFLYVDHALERIKLPSQDLNKVAVDASVLIAAGTPMENRCAR